ncbi:hypothetical protein QOZ80_5BG0430450 [Eleusine coracana subsp. coracana]|nr:hypothetical protein QOZ80_5BG0430450 [Eleusine coracana subsp. coracana]
MRTMRRRGAGVLGLGETTRMGVGYGRGAANLARSSGEKRDGGGTSVAKLSVGFGRGHKTTSRNLGRRFASPRTSLLGIHHDDAGDMDQQSPLQRRHARPPVSLGRAASAAAARAPTDGVDRISDLPDEIIKDIVSRLPAKSAVRTGALASRWRGIWRSVPLVLIDSHVFPDPISTPNRKRMTRDEFVTRAVVVDAASALAAHPGPVRCFYLTSVTWSFVPSHEAEIARWLQLLAAKGVEELVFINRPWPFDLLLPAALFSCTTLTRLHVGIWKFPDTTALPPTAGFPHLRELVLSVLMQDEDLAFMLDRSPILEFLTITASQSALRLRVVSRSLRVRIGNAPNLRMLGYWQPDRTELEITNNIIQARTRVSESTIVPSVRILALEVEFELRNEVKMVPCFLKCFPNVETIYVYSSDSEKSTCKPSLKFWQEVGYIACVQNLKKLVFQEFRGMKSELLFLKFIAENAQALEKMVIILASEYFSSGIDANVTLKSVKWASEDHKLIVLNSPVADSGSPSWDFHVAADFSRDPFDHFTARAELHTNGCD